MTKRMVCLVVCSLFTLGALPAIGQSPRLQRLRVQRSLFVYKTLTYPGSSETEAHGIDVQDVVGYYTDTGGKGHGFLYNGCIYKSIDVPNATQTSAEGINGSNIVGYYLDTNNKFHGFLYDGTTYHTIDVPGAVNTYATGISGNYIVGSYEDTSGARHEHGFFYDGSTYKTLDAPGSVSTTINGISGNLIVGSFTIDVGYTYGCIYDLSPNPSFPPPNFVKSLNFPNSVDTRALGIYGNTIVGTYGIGGASSYLHGFSYDNAANVYATVDKPDTFVTLPTGIYRGTIVGAYGDVGLSDLQGFMRYLDPALSGKPVLKPQAGCQ